LSPFFHLSYLVTFLVTYKKVFIFLAFSLGLQYFCGANTGYWHVQINY